MSSLFLFERPHMPGNLGDAYTEIAKLTARAKKAEVALDELQSKIVIRLDAIERHLRPTTAPRVPKHVPFYAGKYAAGPGR